jgi:hypothetical protein
MMANEPDEDFALTLVGDGISIEKRVNKQVAMAVVAAVLGNGPTAVAGGHRNADQRPLSRLASSPREFLTDSGATNNPQKIVTLGYYICQNEESENFSNDDLREHFRKAHEAIPKNISRDLGSAIKAGWIHETPGKTGRYYITNTGRRLVEDKFGRVESATAGEMPKTALKRPTHTPPRVAQRREDRADSDPGANQKQKKKRGTSGRLKALLNGWTADGFFNEPKTLANLLERYHERGIITKQTSLSGLVLEAVREGLLIRARADVGGKQVWVYRTPNG